jgi:predicted DNA-binding transcriptional regulator YafY
MATNKNAQIRYKILDNCFRNSGKRYFIEDLIAECDKKLREIDPDSKGISRRQIFDDINFMESSEGWEIELERHKENKRVYYRYADLSFSINNMPLDETDINRLQTTLQTISQFKGMPQFEWMYDLLPKLKQGSTATSTGVVIEFENNQDLQGISSIGTIYNAIIYNKVLKIKYMQAFEFETQLIIHPYFLKQYNNRWFLMGYNPEREKYDWNLPLDRIVEITELNDTFVPNTLIDWEEYFEDMIGVTKPENAAPEKIQLQFYGKTGHYIASKPIAGCQKHKWLDSDTLEVTLNLIINYELERFILSYADNVKVIYPESLAEAIKKRLEQATTQYDILNIEN